MKIDDFIKSRETPIKMITCYDYWSANIIAKTNIDSVLVGDSAAQIMHGARDTTGADIDMITTHIKAVKAGIDHKFIIGDMSFMSYRKSISDTISNVEKLIKAGANAIKLEGVDGSEDTIKYIIDSGVPVMGHIGFMPQSINMVGNKIVQGRIQAQAQKLKEQAKTLEQLGCFSIVLECIPDDLATNITKDISIPTIGIGAGPGTDGQILVLQDMLGGNPNFSPKFLKKYVDIYTIIKDAINQYCNEVDLKQFPTQEHSYKIQNANN